jgi:hypothetical protein
MTERGVCVLKFSTNSMRGFCPGVPSKIARVLNREKGPKMWGWLVCYLASSTKLLALLGVGDTVLGVKVAILLHSKYTGKLSQYTKALSLAAKRKFDRIELCVSWVFVGCGMG